MKIIKKNLTAIIMLAAAVIILSGCSDKSKLLVRTWKLDNLRYTSEIPKEMQPAIEKSISEMKTAFSLTYNADGSYSTINNTAVIKGKWKLNWNSSVISSAPDNGEEKDFKIMELTENKFTFKTMEGKEEVIFEMVPTK